MLKLLLSTLDQNMEQINYEQSLKNIPVPDRKKYCHMLINSAEKFLKNARWRAYFFLNPSTSNSKNNFGFRSLKAAKASKEMKNFEHDFIKLVSSIEFRNPSNPFQDKLKSTCESINSDSKLIIPADKTTNFYRLEPEMYENLLEKNIQKDYKKENESAVKKINLAHSKITKDLDINDRVFRTTERQAFVTLKDHKPNFSNNPTCRLLNPCKPEIGRISKKILENINSTVRQKTKLNQWKNSSAVIGWFKALQNKEQLQFIQFDVVEFYPSISKNLLLKSVTWAKEFLNISDQEIDIIMQSKKSILYKDGTPWTKKGTHNFDVAMGSFDGAETCEIVGLYLLKDLVQLGIDLGLYRDDGLGACRLSPKETEAIKKKICQIFKKHNLKITIEANLKVVTFLDVEFNLNKNTFSPYIKPNNKPLYVNAKSNHPPNITKNIPLAVNKRLSEISSNEEIFDKAAPTYQDALDKSGYKFKLKYEPSQETRKQNNTRKRKITWFNPPYAENVETNIGKKFLRPVYCIR